MHSDSCILEHCEDLFYLVQDSYVIISLEYNWNQHCLILSYSWWQNLSFIIRVDHDHRSNTSSGVSPRGLPHILFLTIFVFKPHIKHLGKVLPQLMTSASLYSSSIDRNVQF